MKKLYALLLLGSLLLLGTGNVWADYYLYLGDGTNTAGTKVANFSSIAGQNRATYNVAAAGTYYFYVTNDATAGTGDQYFNASQTFGSSAVQVYKYDIANYEHAIKLVVDAEHTGNYEFYFYESGGKYYLCCEYAVTKKLTIYVNEPTANVDMNCYAWDVNDYRYNGAFPGNNSGNTTITFDGGSWYKHEINVNPGQNISIILSGTINEVSHQTATINIGTVNADRSFYFIIGGESGGNWSYSIPWCLYGNFNSWKAGEFCFDNGLYTASLTAGDYWQFKVTDGETPYGWGSGDNYMTFNSNGYKDIYSGDQHELRLNATTAGDYVFGWAPEVDPKILFVTFPGSYSRYMTVANPWATICLPYAVTAEQRAAANATFYSISHKDATKLYLKEETGDLVAGRPYIFHFDGEADATLTISCGTTASAASNYNGLIGTYKKVRVAENYYMIIGGEVRRVSAESEAYCDATKAYFNANLEGVPTEPSPAPGQRIIEMPLIENNATDINAINATEEVVKFFQNGKLYIQKNGVVYDMMGTIVK